MELVQRKSGPQLAGWYYGMAGMLMFAGGLPATRAAVLSMPAVFVGAGRAFIAALLALALLWLTRQPWPQRQHWPGLAAVALGAVLGYPVLSALALAEVGANHGTLVTSVMPLFTAVFGAWLTRQWPRPAFWLAALTGAGLVASYALQQANGLQQADLLLVLASMLCGYSYARGAVLAKELGSWQVICWALCLSLPLLLPQVLWFAPADLSKVSVSSWIALIYLSVFTMFLGFFAWYKGLAMAGIAQVSQLQLLSPFIGLALASYWLNEPVAGQQWGLAFAVVSCIALGRKLA